jgi:hypothetical protein
VKRESLDHTGVLNLAGKYLARRTDAAGDYAEPWRFPIVESYHAGNDRTGEYWLNRVTFVWRASAEDDRRAISVVGSFDNLWDATPLDPVVFDGQPTLYRAATVLVPKGQIHTYKFLVDGQPTLDPVNPQRIVLDNGIEWSRHRSLVLLCRRGFVDRAPLFGLPGKLRCGILLRSRRLCGPSRYCRGLCLLALHLRRTRQGRCTGCLLSRRLRKLGDLADSRLR